MSAWLASEFVPVCLWRITRDRETPVGADECRILDDIDDAAADFFEGTLQSWSQVTNESAAARESNALPHALLKFRFDFREQRVHRLDNRRNHRFAGGFHF